MFATDLRIFFINYPIFALSVYPWLVYNTHLALNVCHRCTDVFYQLPDISDYYSLSSRVLLFLIKGLFCDVLTCPFQNSPGLRASF